MSTKGKKRMPNKVIVLDKERTDIDQTSNKKSDDVEERMESNRGGSERKKDKGAVAGVEETVTDGGKTETEPGEKRESAVVDGLITEKVQKALSTRKDDKSTDGATETSGEASNGVIRGTISMAEARTMFKESDPTARNSVMMAILVANLRNQIERTLLTSTKVLEGSYAIYLGMTNIDIRSLSSPAFIFFKINDAKPLVNNEDWVFDLDRIPSFFRLDHTMDASYLSEKYVVHDDHVGAVEQINESRRLVEQGTIQVMYVPQSIRIMKEVTCPDGLAPETIVEFSNVTDGAVDPSDILRSGRKRFMTFLEVVFMQPFLLTTFSKVVLPTALGGIDDAHRYGPAIAQLIQGRGVSGDNPTLYLSTYNHPLQWFADRVTRVSAQFPPRFGAFDPITYGGVKIGESFYATTDQFFSRIAYIFHELFTEYKMTDMEYENLLRAHVDTNAIIQNVEPIPETRRFARTVTPYEQRSYLILTFLEPKIVARCRALWAEALMVTNQITTIDPMETILKPGQNTAGVASPLITALASNIKTLSSLQACNWLCLETTMWGLNPLIVSPSLTISPSDVVPLVTALLWPIISPRLASVNLPDLMTIVLRIMRNWNIRTVDEYLDMHQWVGIRADDGRFIPVQGAGLRFLTKYERDQGYTVSLHGLPVQALARFPLLVEIKQCMEIRYVNVVLDRKRNAGLPYVSEDYQARRSWSEAPILGDMTPFAVNLSDRIHRAIALAFRILDMFIGRATARVGSVSDHQVKQQVAAILDMQSIPCAVALTTTMSKLQLSLMESAGFVIDERMEGDGVGSLRTYAIGSLIQEPNARVVRPIHVPRETTEIDFFLPLSLLLGLCGIHGRPRNVDIQMSNRIDGTIWKQREWSVLKLSDVLNDYLALSYYGSKLRVALTLGCMIWRDDLPNRQLQQFLRTLRPFIVFRNYVSVIRMIFNVANVDLPETLFDWYSRVFGSYLADPRGASFALYRCNWQMEYENVRQPANTIFGQAWTQLPDYVEKLAEVGGHLALRDDSPSIRRAVGCVLGRVSHPQLKLDNQFPVLGRRRVIYEPNVTLHFAEGDRGRMRAFHLDGIDYFDPGDVRLMGVLLVVDTIGDIIPLDRAWIAASMADNILAVEATRQVVIYSVSYTTTVNHDHRILEPFKYFVSLLDRPALSYIELGFVEAKFDAIQVTATFGLAPNYYYQYVHLIKPVDKFYVTGPIMGYIQPPEDYTEINGLMFECGEMRPDGHMYTSTGQMKLTMAVPNFCNPLPTVMDTMRINCYPQVRITVGKDIIL